MIVTDAQPLDKLIHNDPHEFSGSYRPAGESGIRPIPIVSAFKGEDWTENDEKSGA